MSEELKKDHNAGIEINEYLNLKHLQTPCLWLTGKNIDRPKDEKIQLIEEKVRDILSILGLDLEDDSLSETPKRVAKMLVDELLWGLDPINFPKCTVIENKFHYDEMIVEKCTVVSLCEHHLVYFGSVHNPEKLGCWVGYIPNKKIIGLSKLSRIVEYFSRRPQVQERLTEQIFHTLTYILETDNVAVVIKAQHFCVLTRGVEDINSYTTTSKLGGQFKTNPIVRTEFMNLIDKAN